MNVEEDVDAMMQEAANIAIGGFGTHLCDYTIQRQFVACFGCTIHIAAMLWCILDVDNLGPDNAKIHHLLWTLMFLKTYETNNILASIFDVDEQTYRKWTWLIIGAIARIDGIVSISFYCILLCFVYYLLTKCNYIVVRLNGNIDS